MYPWPSVSRRLPVLLLGFVAVGIPAAGGCSNPNTPPPSIGIRIVSPPAAADTIEAPVPQALVVEVRDSAGKTVSGATVHFQARSVTVNGVSHPTVLLAPIGSSQFSSVTSAQTDPQGRAAVQVRLGGVAGEAGVNVLAATLGFSAEASFTVHPGVPTQLTAAPADTAVVAGRAFQLRMALRDRRGNAVAPTEISSSGGGAVASLDGTTVAGHAPGRTTFGLTSGGLAATVAVSVVPTGTLVAARADGIYVFDLDGSGYRRVVAQTGARAPRWTPDGLGFVYSVGLGHAFVSDLQGAARRLVPDSPLAAELWAHPSRDGEWVYFGGYDLQWSNGYPHRVRLDGSSMQLVPGFTADRVTQGHPSPSPDGTRLAYFREVGDSRNVLIRRLDMTSGQTIGVDVAGHSPAWSHGDSIAYLDTRGDDRGPIRIMASDGTGQRVLSTGAYGFGIDWSPDDGWIVGTNVALGRLELVQVATGLRIPLPYSAGLFNPSWRP